MDNIESMTKSQWSSWLMANDRQKTEQEIRQRVLTKRIRHVDSLQTILRKASLKSHQSSSTLTLIGGTKRSLLGHASCIQRIHSDYPFRYPRGQ